jgi:hypothetical protein
MRHTLIEYIYFVLTYVEFFFILLKYFDPFFFMAMCKYRACMVSCIGRISHTNFQNRDFENITYYR